MGLFGKLLFAFYCVQSCQKETSFVSTVIRALPNSISLKCDLLDFMRNPDFINF